MQSRFIGKFQDNSWMFQSFYPSMTESFHQVLSKSYLYLFILYWTDPRKSVQSLKCDFKDAAIKKMVLKFGIPSFGGAVAEGNLLFAVSQKTKKLHQISLPDEIPKKVTYQLLVKSHRHYLIESFVAVKSFFLFYFFLNWIIILT